MKDRVKPTSPTEKSIHIGYSADLPSVLRNFIYQLATLGSFGPMRSKFRGTKSSLPEMEKSTIVYGLPKGESERK